MGAAEWFFALGLLAYLAGAAAGLGTWKNRGGRAAVRLRPGPARQHLSPHRLLQRDVARHRRRLESPSALALFPWSVRLDPLSAWFLLALSLLARR